MAINSSDDSVSHQVRLAMKTAFEAHAGQIDKMGEPYFSHCKRVADSVQGDEEKAVAFLHDVVEKGEGWDLERIRELNFSTSVVDAIDALTRRQDETDEEFVVRTMENPLARPVKVADLEDNLQQAIASGTSPAKYKQGLEVIAMLEADPHAANLIKGKP
ncbi:HD domain-containing protein [Rhizobium grahamii]|uniref:Metal dependent phosphohydrolase n=1 Tax=Rhizobium grahamii CCGE 502 TaxID=990285 RepID=S3HE21_9HYPH|nr:HD domain-containing protein [Rhizobium grahamii]EPE96974.1 hypothetical protein RGCCGE502_17425 [Rhizobium grahamii CCGE 502]